MTVREEVQYRNDAIEGEMADDIIQNLLTAIYQRSHVLNRISQNEDRCRDIKNLLLFYDIDELNQDAQDKLSTIVRR